MNRDDLLPALITAAEEAGIHLSATEAMRLAAALAPALPDLAAPAAGPREPWKRWTPEDDERLRAMYEGGASREAICEALGRSPGSLNGALTRLRLRRGGS